MDQPRTDEFMTSTNEVMRYSLYNHCHNRSGSVERYVSETFDPCGADISLASSFRTTLAGLPATIQYGGTSCLILERSKSFSALKA